MFAPTGVAALIGENHSRAERDLNAPGQVSFMEMKSGTGAGKVSPRLQADALSALSEPCLAAMLLSNSFGQAEKSVVVSRGRGRLALVVEYDRKRKTNSEFAQHNVCPISLGRLATQ